MNNFNQYGFPQQDMAFEVSLNKVMRRVYMKMCLALIVTALTAMFTASSGLAMVIASNRLLFWGLMILELVMVFVISGAINKISSPVATLLFYGYSILNGAVLSFLFFAFDLGALAKTFFITAGVFGAMTVYGYFTKTSLAKFGSILYMALFGLIICIVVNMFMQSQGFDYLISFFGVAIFIGLTAWDTQKIKQMIAYDGGANVGKIATMGALSLYLDFINLFLYLLRFFGGSRD